MRALHALPLLALAVAPLACAGTPTSTEACAASAEEALKVCAAGTTVKGVDVSTYQGAVDWTKVKAAGIDFAFARISDGTANPDAEFTANWKGMKAAGVLRGAYQYWRASADPTAQANLVASSLQGAGGMLADDLPVVMDIETADGASASTIEANMKTWLALVEQKTGKKPLLYTSMGTYPISATTYDTYTLWVANYGATCPSMPVGWSAWTFWQDGDAGSVAGISGGVDTDVFNGSLAQLQTFAGGGAKDAGSGGGSGGSSGSSGGSGSGGSSGAGSGGSSGSSSGGSSGAASSSSGAGSSSGGSGSGGGAHDAGAGEAGGTMGAGGGSGGDAGGGSSGTLPCGH
jgi:lysozyme